MQKLIGVFRRSVLLPYLELRHKPSKKQAAACLMLGLLFDPDNIGTTFFQNTAKINRHIPKQSTLHSQDCKTQIKVW
jgi:hypothetical protein